MNDVLSIWTIYDHPLDFPHGFIARRFEVHASGAVPTEDVMRAVHVDPLRRQMMNMGLTRLDRNPGDEPQIVESWL